MRNTIQSFQFMLITYAGSGDAMALPFFFLFAIVADEHQHMLGLKAA